MMSTSTILPPSILKVSARSRRPRGANTRPTDPFIKGCSVCIDMHARMLQHENETNERLFTVAAWRDAPYFTDAERAALALAESVTRLSDRPDPVPDEIWDEAARHYDERQLAALLLAISLINVWNRLNVSTRQVAGEWFKSKEGEEWLKSKAAHA